MTDLNRQAAEAIDWKFGDNIIREEKEYLVICHPVFTVHWLEEFNPIHDDAQAMALLKEFNVCLQILPSGEWNAAIGPEWEDGTHAFENTPNEAILKAIIALSGKGEE